MGDETRKGWWVQVIGLSMLTLWYLGIGIAYIGLLYQQGVHFVGPGEPLRPEVTGRGYVPIVYIGLTVMTATPLVTMLKLRPPGEPRRRHGLV